MSKFSLKLEMGEISFTLCADTTEDLFLAVEEFLTKVGIPSPFKEATSSGECSAALLIAALNKAIASNDCEGVTTYSQAIQRLLSVK